MGGEVLSAFLQVVFQTAITLLLNEVKLLHGLGEETKKLASDVDIIKNVLREAEEIEVKENSLESWLKNLADFAYGAVDKLEELDYEDQRQKLVSMAQVRQVVSPVNPKRYRFRHKMSHEIRSLVGKLGQLMPTADSVRRQAADSGRRQAEGDELSVSTSLHPPCVYGRERDKRVILEMLLRPDTMSGSSVSVTAIHGECGIGKTALAQVVYNDKDVEGWFELRSWVHVSHNFNIRRHTEDIIESIDCPAPNHISNMDILQKQLQKKLSRKRFLLVLDDVWNEKPEEWNKFCLPLLCGAEGSKILVTTRSMAVATTVGSKSYKLKRISDEECWGLLSEIAVGSNLYRHSDMADTAKEILNRCIGLPRLAITIGNQLRNEKDRRKWITNLRSNKQGISGYDDNFRRSIRLNYQQLPADIKPCFAYFAIVPQGFEFEKELMVHFWMALQLIQPLAEDLGSNYFDFLVGRSLVEQSVCDDKRGRHRYRMTEVVHHLAQLVSGEECSILRIGTPCGVKARHVSLICNQFDESNAATPSSSAAQTDIFDKIYQCVGLHTLILLGGSKAYDLKVPDKLASQLSRLRILDLSNCGLKLLPDSLGDLKHLRCLQLRDTNISRLPKTLGRLYNLQTLGLRNCYLLKKLPSDTKNLRKLRHLDLHLDQHPLEFMSRLISMPPKMGLLTDLVILTRFVIGTDADCGLGELKDLNKLQGELIISNLHLVSNAEDAREANLTSKIHIHNLQLQWASRSSTREVRNDKTILSNLKPHENLQELSLVGYSDPSFPSWLSDSTFRHLEVLRLANCIDCESLPRLECLCYTLDKKKI